MNFTKIALSVIAISLAFQTAAFAADADKLGSLVAKLDAANSQTIREKQEQLNALKAELAIAENKGAQYYFKRAAQICGTATAAAAVIAVASGTKTFGKYFGSSADERAGGAMLGAVVGIPGGICTGLTAIIYEMTNGKVETLDALVEAAEIELDMARNAANDKK